MNNKDKIKYSSCSLLSQGYGIIPKVVMKDRRLSSEAKSIYSYMCSYAGSGQTAFPSIQLMIADLNLSENRFYKHRKQLIDNGYITIKKQRKAGKRENNLYILNTEIFLHLQNEGIENEGIENEGIENEGIENEGTNNNNYNNNNLNNNNINNNNYNNNNNEGSCCCSSSSSYSIYKLYENLGFGLLNQSTIEFIESDIEIFGELWVRDALKEASKRGKYNLKYAEGILKNWKANGRSDSNEFGENNSNDNEENEEHIYDGYDFSKFYVKNTGKPVEDIETEY